MLPREEIRVEIMPKNGNELCMLQTMHFPRCLVSLVTIFWQCACAGRSRLIRADKHTNPAPTF
jgi:hypothetical protein